MSEKQQRIHILYPDGNERSFFSLPQFLEESIQQHLGGCFELWDVGSNHNVLAVHEAQMGIVNRLAFARHNVQVKGPCILIDKNDAKETLKDYM